MKTIETELQQNQARHQWKPMEEYKADAIEIHNLADGSIEDKIGVIKKMDRNQYVILENRGTVEHYLSVIEKLEKNGLDIGKGNCQYGWRMPIIEKKRELRIFRR